MSTSHSDKTIDFIGTSAIELLRMFQTPGIIHSIQNAFNNQLGTLATPSLRQYYFVSQGITNLLQDLQRHRNE
jgi:hypothetical protein